MKRNLEKIQARIHNPKKEPSVLDLVKNDIPVPEEWQNMVFSDLIDGIRKNEIPLVYLDFEHGISYPNPLSKSFDFTLYWPGKKPIFYPYGKLDPKWPLFVGRLENIGKKAKKEKYPVWVDSCWHTIHALYEVRKPYCLSKKKTCAWCGRITEVPVFHQEGKYNRAKAFCSDLDCEKKYQNYRYLLRTLVKDGKITKFEKRLRLHPVYSVIDDTLDNSYLLIHDLLSCEIYDEKEEEELSKISDNKFIVKDENVIFLDRTCKNCGALIERKTQAKFCSDKCRFDYHNKQKKKS